MAETSSGTSSGPNSGPPPVKRLPEHVHEGPSSKSFAHGFQPDGAGVKAEAGSSGQLASDTDTNSIGEGKTRQMYYDADASIGGEASPEGIGASAEASAGAGTLTGDAKLNPMLGGLVNVTYGGRLGAADAKAGVTAKLTRREATLKGELGASAVLVEAHAKVEFILTPQRLYNGIIVNGVNQYAEWRHYKTRLHEIHNGALDHGITLSGSGGVQEGLKGGIEGHATAGEKGVSVGAGVTPPGSPFSIGASAGFQ